MPNLEYITYTPHSISFENQSVLYYKSNNDKVEKVLQIFWSDGKPWREANLWAIERSSTKEFSLKTINGNMNGLLNYAKFLEEENVFWFSFPTKKADRCIVQYRGWLIEKRNSGEISPATASEYMRNVIAFYRWLVGKGILVSQAPLWTDKTLYLKFFNSVGFERTFTVLSSELSIPNRKMHGDVLEDGLLPLSAEDRDSILSFAKDNSTPELYRMLAIGFFTGMRIGSICDLKLDTLKNAVKDPSANGLYRLNIGPGASPPVNTKFSVTGQVWIPEALLENLLEYATSIRRSKRQSLAKQEDKNLLFLTVRGNPYCQRASEQSTAINSEMSNFRKIALKNDLSIAKNFKFHQTRATFATELASMALKSGDPLNAIAIVKNALLHRNEATSFKYIKFVQASPIKQQAANEFMKAFLGVKNVI